jgi:hypothetical protein
MDVMNEPIESEAEHNTISNPDADLAYRVRLYLARVGRTVELLTVEADDGVVTLRGRVPSYYTRQLAIACAQRVTGVRAVHDLIRALIPFAHRAPDYSTREDSY